MSTANKTALFQKLPSTDELLRQPEMQALIEREGHSALAESIRVVLARLRQEISSGHITGGQLDEKSLDLALGGLLRVEAEFGVGLATLDIAAGERD